MLHQVGWMQIAESENSDPFLTDDEDDGDININMGIGIQTL